MSLALRLGAAVLALLAACSADLTNKTDCQTTGDCVPGNVCASGHCVPSDGGKAGTKGSGGNGNIGANDGGPPPASSCPPTLVSACPPDDAGSRCAETICGGPPWQNGVMSSELIPYRIVDPAGAFSPAYKDAIRAGAAAWTRATNRFITFQECVLCSGRFVSVVPGEGDGVQNQNPDAAEHLLPMAVSSDGRISPHRIAHQWGHVVGLPHTYERADRDRYLRFDPALWCAPDGPGLPPRCVAGAAGPTGIPAVATGAFGVFDETSKMNGFGREGLCSANEPDEDSGEPTLGDVSAAAELFFGVTSGWSPFLPIGRSVSPTEPLDYQLAPDVDPVGSPAIAEIESEYANPQIFVRGTDGRVYTTARRDPATAEWLDWVWVADGVDADPAVVFGPNSNPERLFLAVRSSLDGDIHLRVRSGGTWGDWTSLGAPTAGAASAPAIASVDPYSLAVFVRGGDGLVYFLRCTDAQNDCAASASGSGVWTALDAPPSGVFVGKPSAVWRDATGLVVAAIRDDRAALVMTGLDDGPGDWLVAQTVTADLAPDDPDPSVAITISSTPGDLVFYARNPQGLLASDTLQTKLYPLGGLLVSPPAATAIYHASIRTDVAAIVDDHGHPGVWWRFNDAAYEAPCADPTTCGGCAP
jgi:hypothetical protein